jgi:mannose-6-phosphate isomerase
LKLDARYVEKPWGRNDLPPIFPPVPGRRIGEIWFGADADLPLLAKYLFTSERLSVQVHPNDEQARLRGLPRGKTECWYILEAEPDATIGLGLREQLTREELRAAALDGSIVEAMDWRAVRRGDFFYVPAGTIHAIGAGISALEFQQNSDVTYRLYDYGRPRELHLEDGLAVSTLAAYPDPLFRHVDDGEERILVGGPNFILVHCRSDRLHDRRRWVLPIEGSVRSGDDTASAGECLVLEAGDRLEGEAARLLIGAAC